MTSISLRTFQPTSRFSVLLAGHIARVFARFRRRYQDFRQRRALAGLSLPEQKDLGYLADEAPADVAARGRNL